MSEDGRNAQTELRIEKKLESKLRMYISLLSDNYLKSLA